MSSSHSEPRKKNNNAVFVPAITALLITVLVISGCTNDSTSTPNVSGIWTISSDLGIARDMVQDQMTITQNGQNITVTIQDSKSPDPNPGLRSATYTTYKGTVKGNLIDFTGQSQITLQGNLATINLEYLGTVNSSSSINEGTIYYNILDGTPYTFKWTALR